MQILTQVTTCSRDRCRSMEIDVICAISFVPIVPIYLLMLARAVHRLRGIPKFRFTTSGNTQRVQDSLTLAIIYRLPGSVSTIASRCLVVDILHSHHGISTTYHRLVFGLSIADIMSSFGFALSSTMAGGTKGNELYCTRRTR